MNAPSPLDLLRHAVAGLLALALVVASLAPATVAAAPRVVEIGGVSISVCADGRGADQGIAHHDCGLCCLRPVSTLPPPAASPAAIRIAVLLDRLPPPNVAPLPAQRRSSHPARAPPIA